MAFVLGLVIAPVVHTIVVVPANDIVTAEFILSFIFLVMIILLCSSKFLRLEFGGAYPRLGVLSGLVNTNCVGGVTASTEANPFCIPA